MYEVLLFKMQQKNIKNLNCIALFKQSLQSALTKQSKNTITNTKAMKINLHEMSGLD